MEIIKRETAFKGYYQLDELEVKSNKTGNVVNREQFLCPNSVGVLVKNTNNNSVILVQQFRIGPEKELLEIVAGKVEGKDLDPERTVMREVMEETGYEVDELKHLFEFYTSPGPVTESMNLYVAKVSKQITKGGGLESENEEISIIEMSIADFKTYSFNDAKTIIAQQWVKLSL